MERKQGKLTKSYVRFDRYPGPRVDPLFHACFECPYEDCHYDVNRPGECPFRAEWAQKHNEEAQRSEGQSAPEE